MKEPEADAYKKRQLAGHPYTLSETFFFANFMSNNA